MSETPPQVHWHDDDGQPQQARWRSLAGHSPPATVVVADDTLSADKAFQLARQGTGLLWRGDYQNARHLMKALGRRLDAAAQAEARAGASATSQRRTTSDPSAQGLRAELLPAADASPAMAVHPQATAAQQALAQAFAVQRRQQAARTRVLGQLLLPFNADHGLPLRRAPDVRSAGLQAHGVVGEHYVASLRELLGLVGAFEWRKKGVPIAALGGATIHPHHGVFSPVRGEYVDLVAQTALPAAALTHGAWDIGCGTGVLAAVLAQRGLRVVATDMAPAALACAADNLRRLSLARKVSVQQADLFPAGQQTGLAVCNPPWVPAPASSTLEAAVYDPDSRMLRGFLAGVAAHLVPGGEGWLILSDLAEHLGLRPRAQLLGWIRDAGLKVLGRHDTRPRHARAADASDPLFAARAAELTSLWRLGVA